MNILITGASRGIGGAAYALLKSTGHQVAGHSTGGIDALVNNAGIYEAVADDVPDDEWRAQWQRTLTINLQASADLCRLAVGHFREAGGGRIVNVASRAAFRGDSPSHWHYAASK